MDGETFDYVIVGAGSAGCVLAERLSADPRNSVLLLEAGGDGRGAMIDLPKGMGRLIADPRHTWAYEIDQPREPGVSFSETWVRGKGLGGSSLINGMIYVRGQPQDYDGWAALGGHGWGWAEMKRAFRAIEHHSLGSDDLRGSGGPLHITHSIFRYPLTEAMLRAGEQMGLPRRDDLNREDQEGVGYFAHNIRRGRRQSASIAFLSRAAARPNLRIVTGVLVDRVEIEGERAVGVACRIDGLRTSFRCRGEVILSAGTLHSPKILQLSGIGPGAHLAAHGIPVVCDRPDVGARMRDHASFSMPHRLRGDPGLNRRLRGLGLAVSVIEYYALRRGPLATGPFEVGAFVRTSATVERPDAQLYIGAHSFARSEHIQNFRKRFGAIEATPGLTINAQMLRPTSEGTVLIQSPDPDVMVKITPNWLTTERDQRNVVDMIRTMRRFIDQPSLAPFIAEELFPGRDVEDYAALLAVARRRVTGGLHAVATCRMGDDPDAVVDHRLRVRGIDGLRVVDCSIMPTTISGNTNGPAMAVGWRAAELILEDKRRNRDAATLRPAVAA